MLYRLLRPLASAALRIAFRFRTVGREHVPSRGPVLLASNHVSVLDPTVVGAGVRRPLHFMAKAELFGIPLFGTLIRRLNAHPVEREGSDAAALRHALLLLRQGQALLMFPEGTRGTEGRLQSGRPGTGMLAALSGATVIPVYIEGTGRALPRGARRLRRAAISVRYGPPLRFERSRGRHRYQEISDQIMAAIGHLKAEAEQARPAGPDSPPRTTNAERTARGPLPVGQQH